MKKNVIILCYLAIVSSLYSYNFPQPQDHPRLFLSQSDFQKLDANIAQNKDMARLEQIIINVADSMLTLPPITYHKVGRRLLGVSRTCLKRTLFLSYAYRATGDAKYKNKAVEEMLAAADFKHWNTSHYLDTAEMTLGMAIGYDWLYHDMSLENREAIKNAIIEKGLKTAVGEAPHWTKMENNWNQVCNAGMTAGSIAVFEDAPEMANEIINRALTSIKLAEHEYEPDGVYPEGSMYWSYGTNFNVLFMDMLLKAWPEQNLVDVNQALLKSGEFMLHVFGPAGSFNFSDNRGGKGLAEAMFWIASHTQNPSILFNQQTVLRDILEGTRKISFSGNSSRLFPFALLWFGDTEKPIVKPQTLSWSGQGSVPVSLHRTSWEDNAIYIGVKGGSPSANHGHMDAGSFVMDANGERWVHDLGMHDYHALEAAGVDLWNRNQDSERWQVFRYTNFAHNTLVVDDELQQVTGQAPILKTFDSESLKGAVVDFTSIYSNKLSNAVRTIGIINNARVEIADELKNSPEKSNVRWAICTYDDITFTEKNSAIVNKNGKKCVLQVLLPQNVQLEKYTVQPKNEFEHKNPGMCMLGFMVPLEENESKTIKVILKPQQ